MRCRCGPCPTRPVGRVTRGNVIAAIGVGRSAVLEVDRIRRYPIRTETTRLEENSRAAFTCGYALHNAERESFHSTPMENCGERHTGAVNTDRPRRLGLGLGEF
jgi:hypothetical protein